MRTEPAATSLLEALAGSSTEAEAEPFGPVGDAVAMPPCAVDQLRFPRLMIGRTNRCASIDSRMVTVNSLVRAAGACRVYRSAILYKYIVPSAASWVHLNAL